MGSLASVMSAKFGSKVSHYDLSASLPREKEKSNQRPKGASSQQAEHREEAKTRARLLRQNHTESSTYEELSTDEKRRQFKEELNCSWCAENIKDGVAIKDIAWLERRRSSCCDRCSLRGRRRSSVAMRSLYSSSSRQQSPKPVPQVNVIGASTDTDAGEVHSSTSRKPLDGHKLDESEEGAEPIESLPKRSESVASEVKVDLAAGEGSQADTVASESNSSANSLREPVAGSMTTLISANVLDFNGDENDGGPEKASDVMQLDIADKGSQPDCKQTQTNGDTDVVGSVLGSLRHYEFGSPLDICDDEEQMDEGQMEEGQMDEAKYDDDVATDVSLEVNHPIHRSQSICTICEGISEIEIADITRTFERELGEHPLSVVAITNVSTDVEPDCLGSVVIKDGSCSNVECGRLCQLFNHGQDNEFDDLDTEVMRLMDTLDKLSVVLAEKER